MPDEMIPEVLLEAHPDLPAIVKAIDEYKADKPVTQRSQAGELMSVYEDKELGVLIVQCGGRTIYRSSVAPTSPEN